MINYMMAGEMNNCHMVARDMNSYVKSHGG